MPANSSEVLSNKPTYEELNSIVTLASENPTSVDTSVLKRIEKISREREKYPSDLTFDTIDAAYGTRSSTENRDNIHEWILKDAFDKIDNPEMDVSRLKRLAPGEELPKQTSEDAEILLQEVMKDGQTTNECILFIPVCVDDSPEKTVYMVLQGPFGTSGKLSGLRRQSYLTTLENINAARNYRATAPAKKHIHLSFSGMVGSITGAAKDRRKQDKIGSSWYQLDEVRSAQLSGEYTLQEYEEEVVKHYGVTSNELEGLYDSSLKKRNGLQTVDEERRLQEGVEKVKDALVHDYNELLERSKGIRKAIEEENRLKIEQHNKRLEEFLMKDPTFAELLLSAAESETVNLDDPLISECLRMITKGDLELYEFSKTLIQKKLDEITEYKEKSKEWIEDPLMVEITKKFKEGRKLTPLELTSIVKARVMLESKYTRASKEIREELGRSYDQYMVSFSEDTEYLKLHGDMENLLMLSDLEKSSLAAAKTKYEEIKDTLRLFKTNYPMSGDVLLLTQRLLEMDDVIVSLTRLNSINNKVTVNK